ncbi:hypothetical protein [Streptomyces eurythermus]|uniref:hypothetical protein n=1 Tax=Streptomyces eurythermus TaxID=42237 RepID=UPI0033F10A33
MGRDWLAVRSLDLVGTRAPSRPSPGRDPGPFLRLSVQRRLARRGTRAVEAARPWPARYVVFDLLHAGTNLVRAATEAIVGAVTGSLAAPRTVLPGRYDAAGRPQYTGRGS